MQTVEKHAKRPHQCIIQHEESRLLQVCTIGMSSN